YPVRQRHEVLRESDGARVARPISEHLPYARDDDVPEKQHDARNVHDLEGEIGHRGPRPRGYPLSRAMIASSAWTASALSRLFKSSRTLNPSDSSRMTAPSLARSS